MKKIYFVRHGESTGNAGTFRQGPDTPLSDLGLQQARFVADRFKNISIDKLIVSTYERAKQTAEIINAVLNKEMEISDLLVERIKPSRIVGKEKNDPEAMEIDRLNEENFHNPDFKFEDGETFAEMKTRASKVLQQCVESGAQHILIVTHGIFLRMLAAYVVLGEELTSHAYWQFYTTLEVENTSITVFKRDMWRGQEQWYIESWNDSMHLGQISGGRNDTI